MKYAPILISVYNRPMHFKQCIKSLQKNKHADKSHLYIAIDAPYREEDIDGNNAVKKYAKNITNFNKVTLFIRDTNLGIRENLSKARKEIFSKYDTLIFSEDDNIFATDFLDFINRGLEVYKDREDILSVCGYNYPVEIPESYNKDVYVWKGMSAWGYGTWKEKISEVRLNNEKRALQEVREFLKKPKEVLKFSNIADHYLPALLTMDYQNKVNGDGYICLYQYLNNMYSVFPIETKVKNIGYDGSGLNCKVREDDLLTRQKINKDDVKTIFPFNLKPDGKINKKVKDYFKKSILKKSLFIYLLLLNKIGLKKIGNKIFNNMRKYTLGLS